MLRTKRPPRSIPHTALLQLQSSIHGAVITPEDLDYDATRMNWNLAYDQHPAVIVVVANREDIVQAVRFAMSQDLEIAVKSTGHGVYMPANDCLLVNTSKFNGVQIDVHNQTAHVEAGAVWGDVLKPAQQVGLAPLLGSSPDVGVVGYTLGGGMGWLARKYGLAADSVINFEIVTPNGDLINANSTDHSDLFWALRGGGGNFGIVVSMTIRLYPVTTVYGGNLYYPIKMAREVLSLYSEWVEDVPNELTSAVTLMNYPPIPEMPDFLRGQSYVQVRGCYAGSVEEGEKLMAFWRNWETPVVDDFKAMPFSDVGLISNDPVDPLPGLSTHAWLHTLNQGAIDALVRFVPAESPVTIAEIRHAGGAITTSNHNTGAYSRRDEVFSLQMIGITPTAEAYTRLETYMENIKGAMSSALSGGIYLNFAEGTEARSRSHDGFTADAYAQLQRVKTAYDPDNRFDHSFNLLS